MTIFFYECRTHDTLLTMAFSGSVGRAPYYTTFDMHIGQRFTCIFFKKGGVIMNSE